MPRVASHTRRGRVAAAMAGPVGVVPGLLVGAGQDLVGRLDRLELGVDFALPSRVAVGVIPERCAPSSATRRPCLSRRQDRRRGQPTKLPELPFDLGNVGSWRQLQVTIIVAVIVGLHQVGQPSSGCQSGSRREHAAAPANHTMTIAGIACCQGSVTGEYTAPRQAAGCHNS